MPGINLHANRHQWVLYVHVVLCIDQCRWYIFLYEILSNKRQLKYAQNCIFHQHYVTKGSTWRRGGIRLTVGFQPLMFISPTASWIQWRMKVYACELMWTCLVWVERSTTDSFWVPSHRFNSATGDHAERNHSDHLYWLQAEKRKPPSFTSFVWRSRGSNPGLPRPERML